jgi:hypothetical protein
MSPDPYLFRAIERLLSVVIGGLSIYLGYRLFAAVKATGEGDAQVKLPGDITVMMSRVAPGVFFALFGAVVVAVALGRPVSTSEITRTAAGGASERTSTVSGLGGSAAGPQDSPAELAVARLRIRDQIMFLNRLDASPDPQTSEQEARAASRHIRDIKLYLMRSVWGADWGDTQDFQLWVEGGAAAADSDAFREARRFYDSGQPAAA